MPLEPASVLQMTIVVCFHNTELSLSILRSPSGSAHLWVSSRLTAAAFVMAGDFQEGVLGGGVLVPSRRLQIELVIRAGVSWQRRAPWSRGELPESRFVPGRFAVRGGHPIAARRWRGRNRSFRQPAGRAHRTYTHRTAGRRPFFPSVAGRAKPPIACHE